MIRTLRALPSLAFLLALPLAAQVVAPDTARVHALDPVTVAAERTDLPLAASTAAVTVLRGDALRALPVRGVGDALRLVPGLSPLDFGGTGESPVLTVRGFYGAGEAEYVTVLVDGVPVNAPHTGVVDWDLIPLAAVERIEVLRGGASALYGDAAVGAVVNVVTRAPERPRWRGSVGEVGGWEAAGAGRLRGVELFGGARGGEASRRGDRRDALTAGAAARVLERGGTTLSLSTLHRWRRAGDAGPLTAAELTRSRDALSPFHRHDVGDERLHRLSVAATEARGRGRLTASLAGELRARDEVRTLLLAPGFADTRRRELETARLLHTLHLDAPFRGGRVTAGVDAALSRFSSTYHALLTGGAEAYDRPDLPDGQLDDGGDGVRAAGGAFLRWEARPVERFRLSLGGRLDRIADRFTPRDGAGSRASHAAFSPRVGANLAVAGGTHLFASAGRSFKAATPDQLFDRRALPVPFPPGRVILSNPELRPQRGSAYELGVHHLAWRRGTGTVRVTAALHRIDMRDELDFDLRSLRYVNLGRSRHRGVESSIEGADGAGRAFFVAHTLQAAVSRAGDDRGKALKAIPRHTLSAGGTVPLPGGTELGVAVTETWGIWLDDENTRRLPGWRRVDARLSAPLPGGVRGWVEGHNLLDRAYATTGYADAADPTVVYYFPAARRGVRIGIGSR